MARCATTRSQLSQQFHWGYVFRARHSKILGCAGHEQLRSRRRRDTFLPEGLESARSPRWPRRIPLGSTDLPPVSLSFSDRLYRQAVVKRDRNSDKSSANCIYAVQKRNRCKYDDYRLIVLRRRENPFGARLTRDERRLIHQLALSLLLSLSLSGLFQVYKTLVRLHEHVRNFDHSLTESLLRRGVA